MSLFHTLRRAERASRDMKAIASGDPRRIAKRARNRAISKALGAAGLWRLLNRLYR